MVKCYRHGQINIEREAWADYDDWVFRSGELQRSKDEARNKVEQLLTDYNDGLLTEYDLRVALVTLIITDWPTA